jgi:hypothetical protein
VSLRHVELDEVGLDCSMHDPVGQRVTTQHVTLGPGGISFQPVELRYAWPAELDLMATLAGLQRTARWGSWDRRPFTADSTSHVSIWQARS